MIPMVSMRAALGDDDLLGKALKGDSWFAWRVLLIACVGGEELHDDERKVFVELTGGRVHEPLAPCDEIWALTGRRSGKTKTAAVAAVWLSALNEHPGLAAGERASLPILSATTWQSQRAFNLCRGVFAEAPALEALIESETQDTIRLKNRVDIECRPASYRTIRGATAIAFIADETSFWWSAEQARNPDAAILAAARPALATTGGPLICVSSPYGKRGESWNTFKRDYGPHGDPKVCVVNATSRRMNPTLSEAIVIRAYARDKASADSEFGGLFRTDIAGFLDLAVIEAAVDRGVLVRPPRKGVSYRSGCDMSGGAHDSAVIAIAHDEDDVAVLDAMLEIKAPFNPTEAVRQISALLREYGLSSTVGDKYASGWIPDAFANAPDGGITYAYSEVDRSEAYLRTLPKFMSGKVRLIDNQRLISQFASLERRTTVVGRDRVDHGPGGKDDCCNAAALALSLKSSSYWDNDMAWVSGPSDPLAAALAVKAAREAAALGPPLNPTPRLADHPMFRGVIPS
jgi:hypothetical protein